MLQSCGQRSRFIRPRRSETLKRLSPGVSVLLVNLSRSVEQLEALRFEAVNPTFLLRAVKRS